MDIHSLAATKLAERHLARFDPGQEEAYYRAQGGWPWWVRALPRAVRAIANLCRRLRGATVTRALATRKAGP